MKLLAVVGILLAVGLIAWILLDARRDANDALNAVHAAFESCAKKDDDLQKVKTCVSDQLKNRGPYVIEISSDGLSIRNFISMKPGAAPGDMWVFCHRSPSAGCSP